MSVFMIGIDHNHAALDVRGVFSFTKEQMKQLFCHILDEPEIDGCVIISTCNRMEMWFSGSPDADWDPVSFLCGYLQKDVRDYQDYFIRLQDAAAAEHLFRLAAGLESRILGEDQIITQVGDALMFARSMNSTDGVLEVLFRQAVTAAKRAKTETVLSLADRSVIHSALDGLEERGIFVRGRKCMVIGNGMMGRPAARTLRERGGEVSVTVRKYHHKEVEVPEGCLQMDYTDRYAMIPDCDIIVSATSSPHYTLDYQSMQGVRLDHPLAVLDLAVPRDVEPGIAELPDIALFDVDTFRIDWKSDQLMENIRAVEAIMKEEQEVFENWYAGRNCVPQIRSIKDAAGQDAMKRLIPYLRHVSLEPEEKQDLKKEIAGASSRMMNHLLFSLRTKLKEDRYREVLAAMQQILHTEE